MIIIEKIIIKTAWYEYINVSKYLLSNLSLIAPPKGPPSNIGRASKPIMKVVNKGDFVISYANQPITTCWSQKAPLKIAVDNHRYR